ncbi:hypothetical protein EX30DRAFT_342591 [Ascodesmis nigricans]|uniref:Uncharacterized protein n=1 Tax=Ascodesmis nigricans TaxID=341454 RepID=A0A4V3SI83_9PEZI|nr:hypothetical protein EX30DRAFT_342591 [Ascodesmis nigricans]
MSQDLFNEFSPFSNTPSPAPPPSDHRRSVSSVSQHSLNPFPPKRGLPGQHFQGHRQVASSSTFDDLLGLSPLPGALNRSPGSRLGVGPSPLTRPGSSIGEQRAQRPSSYGGQGAFGGLNARSPRIQELDPFAAFNDAFGSGGGGGSSGRRPADSFSEFTRTLNATPATSLNIPMERRSSSSSVSRRSMHPKPVPPPSIMDDDDFGDFISTPTSSPPPSHIRSSSQLSMRSLRSPSTSESLPVPPVAILLTLFPPLFSLPSTALLNHLTPLSFGVRQRILATPEARRFLAAICEMGRVCGRIITGRQRRRKRTIGRGGTTQHEIQTEEREVKEVVRQWQENAGRLKAAMKEAVPELPEDAWKGQGAGVGGVRCRLCALEENEVVPGLRENRSHPRWWDWGWGGHGTCKAFWERHGRDLQGKR